MGITGSRDIKHNLLATQRQRCGLGDDRQPFRFLHVGDGLHACANTYGVLRQHNSSSAWGDRGCCRWAARSLTLLLDWHLVTPVKRRSQGRSMPTNCRIAPVIRLSPSFARQATSFPHLRHVSHQSRVPTKGCGSHHACTSYVTREHVSKPTPPPKRDRTPSLYSPTPIPHSSSANTPAASPRCHYRHLRMLSFWRPRAETLFLVRRDRGATYVGVIISAFWREATSSRMPHLIHGAPLLHRRYIR